MAKLDIDFESIGKDLQNPAICLNTYVLPDDQMAALGLRRKKAGQATHNVWYLTVGESGQNPLQTFWGHKPTECIIQALKWKGVYVKHSKGPRKSKTTPAT